MSGFEYYFSGYWQGDSSDLRATPMARKWIVPASHSCYVECRVQLKRTRREADRSSCKWREVVYETGAYVVRRVGICNGSPGISTSTRSCSGFSHSVTIFWPDLKRLGCARPVACRFVAHAQALYFSRQSASHSGRALALPSASSTTSVFPPSLPPD
jgi:hypothetical protein